MHTKDVNRCKRNQTSRDFPAPRSSGAGYVPYDDQDIRLFAARPPVWFYGTPWRSEAPPCPPPCRPTLS